MDAVAPFADPLAQSIPARFELEVARGPDRLAVKTREHALSYGALNQAANRVAHAILAERGRGEEPVALLLESGAAMVAAILGALKAGKIYVPLDPSLPRPRTGFILEDSEAGLIVTNGRNRGMAAALAAGRRPLIDIDALGARLSTENPDLPIAPSAPAWILYTSGSTGQPKGVVQTHENVLHFVMIYAHGLGLRPSDRLTLLFSCAVNGGAHDIFTALLTGASLYPLDVKQEGVAGLADWLDAHAITVYTSVPTVFRHFLDTLSGEARFPHLRAIKLIGEPTSRRDVERYQRHFAPGCVLINRLGSTETGTIRWHFMTKDTAIDGSLVPVGYAVPDNEVLLLDERGAQVAPGEAGEIAVRSRYLAAGYWRRPDLTQAAFSAQEDGARLFRTGDLGRLLPDGCLLCLGRTDGQVKIRGHRIEVAEVELALLRLPTIKEAVVAAREDQPGEPRLVAYLAAAVAPAPSVTLLRQQLAETLPAYMIPSAFVVLGALPKAPNGKVDRRAMPAPPPHRPALDTPFAAPRTPLEQELAELWAEVLGLDRVGVDDDFLDLGGHSLLATRITSRVLDRFRVDLPLAAVFEAPTVAGLAVTILEHRVAGAGLADLDRS